MTSKLLDIVDLDVDQIVPYENNPRKIDQAAVDAVASSLNSFQWRQPVVVWPNPKKNNQLEIVVGHTRLLAAQKLGIKVLPVHIAKDLTEKQVNQYRVIDNKSGEKSLWDFAKLQIEMTNNFDLDDDLVKFNWTPTELDTIIQADWTPQPESVPEESGGGKNERHQFLLTKDQWFDVMAAVNELRSNEPTVTDGEALQRICQEWIKTL